MRRWIFILTCALSMFTWIGASPMTQDTLPEKTGWLPKFPIERCDIELSRAVRPGTYFEAIGRQTAVIGLEQGILEVWIYPFKILHSFRFSIVLEGRSEVLEANDIAERITVRPEAVTITYVADTFTLREHIFAPVEEPGAIILLDVDTDQPLSLICSFSPALEPMWPGGLGGQYTYWDTEIDAFIISESRKKYGGMIGSSLGMKGSSTPAHELPKGEVRFEIAVQPDSAKGSYIPIILSGGAAGIDSLRRTYNRLLASVAELYDQTRIHYRELQNRFLGLRTPNEDFNVAFEWAKVAIDKGLACNPHLGCGLVAGFGPSGTSERPGFAWYFGGDAFMNSFAINSYGDFATTRQTLAFLRQYQRDDGKMMHELSQSGGMIPWFEEYPYCYYHADTTPYYIVAVRDYVRVSNDTAFLEEMWDSVKDAFDYCLSCETDGDGLMENTKAGLGAVELGTLLKKSHTDIYLAGIWVEAIKAFGELASAMGDNELEEESERLFEKAHRSLNERFWNEEKTTFNFALTTDGGVNDEVTAWPAVPIVFGLLDRHRAASMLDVLASSQLSTDWGVRMLTNRSTAYEPLSYNNGAVWPFLTGYSAWAEYRSHRPLSGYMHLMDMVRLTFIDALGYNPELLSGDRYRPLRTAVPHQIFSSSFVVTSAVRGLLGLEGDAEKRQVTFSPHIPFEWDWLHVKQFRVGETVFDFKLEKDEGKLLLSTERVGESEYHFVFSPAFGPATEICEVTVDEREAEYQIIHNEADLHCLVEFVMNGPKTVAVSFTSGIELGIPEHHPQIGDRSSGFKILNSYLQDDEFMIMAEGIIGASYRLTARMPFPVVSVEGGNLVKEEGTTKTFTMPFHQDVTVSDMYVRKLMRIRVER